MTDLQLSRTSSAADDAAATYDRLSRYYDLLTGFGERDLTESGLKALQPHDGEQVLEIGCGTGQGLLALSAMVGDSGLVHGVDISEGMCRVAGDKVRDAGLDDRVIIARGDARELPYGIGEFDAVFLSFTLELFDAADMCSVLWECRRVLREHGHLAVVSLSSDQGLGLVGRLYQWLHGKFPTYLDCRPIPVERTLRDAGFEQVHAEARSIWGLPVEIAVGTSTTGPEGDRRRFDVRR